MRPFHRSYSAAPVATITATYNPTTPVSSSKTLGNIDSPTESNLRLSPVPIFRSRFPQPLRDNLTRLVLSPESRVKISLRGPPVAVVECLARIQSSGVNDRRTRSTQSVEFITATVRKSSSTEYFSKFGPQIQPVIRPIPDLRTLVLTPQQFKLLERGRLQAVAPVSPTSLATLGRHH